MGKKIVEYHVIIGDTVDILSAKVNRHIVGGWELYGNAFLKDNMFCQPMVRYEIVDEETKKEIL